jgi:hypothetical protein
VSICTKYHYLRGSGGLAVDKKAYDLTMQAAEAGKLFLACMYNDYCIRITICGGQAALLLMGRRYELTMQAAEAGV